MLTADQAKKSVLIQISTFSAGRGFRVVKAAFLRQLGARIVVLRFCVNLSSFSVKSGLVAYVKFNKIELKNSVCTVFDIFVYLVAT